MRIKIEDIRIGNEYFAVSFDMGGVPTANYIRAEGVELLHGKYYIVCQNSKYKLENLRYTEAEMWTLIDDILSTIRKNIVEQYKIIKEILPKLHEIKTVVIK